MAVPFAQSCCASTPGLPQLSAIQHDVILQDAAAKEREQLKALVETTDKQVADLAAWFGEPVSNDPAGVLVALWAFVQSFDQAYRRVQLLQSSNASPATSTGTLAQQ